MNRKICSIAAVAAMMGAGCGDQEVRPTWSPITAPRPDLECWSHYWTGEIECWPKVEPPRPEARTQPPASDCNSKEPAGK